MGEDELIVVWGGVTVDEEGLAVDSVYSEGDTSTADGDIMADDHDGDVLG